MVVTSYPSEEAILITGYCGCGKGTGMCIVNYLNNCLLG